MPGIIVHTMKYKGDLIQTSVMLEQYTNVYFDEYKRIYEDCFREMRKALDLQPVNACDSKEELLKKRNDIFLYLLNGTVVGSVAIYENEIDDLIVEKNYQRKGYGKLLLEFAISHIQKKSNVDILLHVVDWNKNAIKLYLKNGFEIIETKTVKV